MRWATIAGPWPRAHPPKENSCTSCANAPPSVRSFPGQAEVADRDRPPADALGGAVAVGEGVELLDIAERMAGLLLDPLAQARLQRPVGALERSGRQAAAVSSVNMRGTPSVTATITAISSAAMGTCDSGQFGSNPLFSE